MPHGHFAGKVVCAFVRICVSVYNGPCNIVTLIQSSNNPLRSLCDSTPLKYITHFRAWLATELFFGDTENLYSTSFNQESCSHWVPYKVNLTYFSIENTYFVILYFFPPIMNSKWKRTQCPIGSHTPRPDVIHSYRIMTICVSTRTSYFPINLLYY